MSMSSCSGRVTCCAEHAEAARLGHRRHHVPAMGERHDRDVAAQHLAHRCLHAPKLPAQRNSSAADAFPVGLVRIASLGQANPKKTTRARPSRVMSSSPSRPMCWPSRDLGTAATLSTIRLEG